MVVEIEQEESDEVEEMVDKACGEREDGKPVRIWCWGEWDIAQEREDNRDEWRMFSVAVI
jgi:hypothetical protein